MDQPSLLKRYRPYYRAGEIERMSARQRGKLSIAREERMRQQACTFIDAVGVRCGFPRRTIATAQTLYHRFHLFFPYAEFHYIEVSLTTLYVACKLHDTLKKPRDIILASYALRFPHLIRKTTVDISAVDPATLEAERRRVLSVERLVLETQCFAFSVAVPFTYVVKIGRNLGLPADELFSPSPVSPREPSRSTRPSPVPASVGGTAYRLAPKWTPQALTELKIHLRERRPGEMPWDEESDGEGVEGMGRSDATVRFVWD
ncbi:hypothetical protein CcaverHIS002_0502830 [Cutaneotrichosporon cavernicola]|nr:hypothetical protein CcaverHIS002_0502830 [Cutaneotrichosporon cavernicola]